VSIKLNPTDSNLILVAGQSYRVGQIGAFVRIPVGYSDLYAVSTQVGADSMGVPSGTTVGALEDDELAEAGSRWLTVALFGESTSGRFERGVSFYPTIGDEVHVLTSPEMDAIYDRRLGRDDLTIGRIASSSGIPAQLQLSTLVSRHSSIVGSTGSGKSNLVAVIIEELASGDFPSARVLVIDPHGEYGSVAAGNTGVITTDPTAPVSDRLHVPYWALPVEQLLALTMGDLQPTVTEHIRERIRDLRIEASAFLADPPPSDSITADSPIPFSIRRLWFELEDRERQTFTDSQKQNLATLSVVLDAGDPEKLRVPQYPPATSFNTAPYPNRSRQNISRQLDLMRSRLRDDQFSFMFDTSHPTYPDLQGRVSADLDTLLTAWVGGDKAVTVVDVSGIPTEALSIVVGTLLRIVYDALFWAMNLAVGGKAQPLLVVLDEAHLFLPDGGDTPAHRIFSRIAKEGRKYGVGLMVVSQRPSDIDGGILSQCGTMIALRVTNGLDRSAVSGAVPDDLGGLIDMLPSLRTGEALVLGEALQVPSRVRVRRAKNKPAGTDPDLPAAWLDERPDVQLYNQAVKNWRLRSTSAVSLPAVKPLSPAALKPQQSPQLKETESK
jgi:uncharacterized protein